MSAAPEGLRERVNACLKPMVGLVASHPWMGAAYDACWELIAAELDLGVRRAVGPAAARAREELAGELAAERARADHNVTELVAALKAAEAEADALALALPNRETVARALYPLFAHESGPPSDPDWVRIPLAARLKLLADADTVLAALAEQR